jgi:hypothetical protein
MLPPFLRVCIRLIFVYFNSAGRAYGNTALASQTFVAADSSLAVFDAEYLCRAGIDTFAAAGAKFFIYSHNKHRNSFLKRIIVLHKQLFAHIAW